MKDITVIILAGGKSSRFWPLKDKLFVNFLGKPLLYYRLNQLIRAGFSDIVIVHNQSNKNLFIRFQKDYPEFSFKLVNQTDPRGMAGAIISAQETYVDKSIIVFKPLDLFEDILFMQFKEMLKKDPDNLLTGIAMKSYFPGGYITMENNSVKHIVEKPQKGKEPSNIVRLVFDYFKEPEVFYKFIKSAKSPHDDLYEVALENMLVKGHKFNMMEYKGYWGYLQYPWHVLTMSENFLSKLKNHKGNNVRIASSAVIKGYVYLDDNVTVLENAKIVGPTYIGRNTVIGNNNLVRNSMIGQNCVLGFGTEVTRSHIGNSCWFHTNYIGDSVIEDNVGLGSGAVLANFRLDEKTISSFINSDKINTNRNKLGAMIGENVRIGVNASIMPGIKIGKNSYVSSGIVLDKDLAENQACFIKGGYITSPNYQAALIDRRDNLKINLKI